MRAWGLHFNQSCSQQESLFSGLTEDLSCGEGLFSRVLLYGYGLPYSYELDTLGTMKMIMSIKSLESKNVELRFRDIVVWVGQDPI